MDNIKKTVIALAAALVVAIGSFFAMDLPVGDAISIAMDKDKARQACIDLINYDTPGATVVAE